MSPVSISVPLETVSLPSIQNSAYFEFVLCLNSKCWACKRVKNLCEGGSCKTDLIWNRRVSLYYTNLI